MKKLGLYILLIAGSSFLTGCGSSKQTEKQAPEPNRELALQHYLEGSMLDQKEDYANAILEYQEALLYDNDPAVYYALSKDYSILGKHALAAQMGKEAVKLSPNNRTYHETLGSIFVNAREIDNAISEFEEVVRIDSDYVDGWHNLAGLMEFRKPLRALELYHEILNRFGTNWDVYYQMMQIYSTLGKLDKAIGSLKGMLALDPGNFEVKKTLGDMYLQTDSVDAALRVYDDLVELQPNDLELRAAIAHAFLVKQDYNNAAIQFESVMKQDTLSVEDQLRFGQVFVSFIQKDSAVLPYAKKLFNQIERSHPSDWRPHWFLGAIDNILGDDSSALEHYRKVKELAPTNPDGWVGIASAYYDAGKFDDAAAVLTEAEKNIPQEFRIKFLLGITYQRMHKTEEAASMLEDAVQLNAKSIEALSSLGLVYDELKRHEDSDSVYERALRIDGHNHLVLNNYGYSLAERGIQLDRALKMAAEAVHAQPANQSYLDTYGWVFYRLERYKEAEEQIRKAIDLGSASPVLYDHLGDIYFKLDDKTKAVQCWEKSFQIDSTNEQVKEKIQRNKL